LIVMLCVVFCMVFIGTIVFCYKRRKNQSQQKKPGDEESQVPNGNNHFVDKEGFVKEKDSTAKVGDKKTDRKSGSKSNRESDVLASLHDKIDEDDEPKKTPRGKKSKKKGKGKGKKKKKTATDVVKHHVVK